MFLITQNILVTKNCHRVNSRKIQLDFFIITLWLALINKYFLKDVCMKINMFINDTIIELLWFPDFALLLQNSGILMQALKSIGLTCLN